MKRGKIRQLITLSIAALWIVFAAFYIFSAFGRAENYLYDKIYQSVSQPDARIAVIAIDDASLERIGQWPWPRGVMADTVDKLAEGGAAAVGIDVLFDTPSPEPGEDEKLAQAVGRGNVVLALYRLFKGRTTGPTGIMNEYELILPTEALRAHELRAHELRSHKSGPLNLAHVNGLTDSDGVMRRALFELSHDGKIYRSLAYETAKIYKGADFQDEVPRDSSESYYIKFTGRSRWFRPLSFSDVYEGRVPPAYFKGKVVLIGLYAQGVARDWQFTSIDGDIPTYGVEIHANMLQQFLTGDYLRDFPKPLGFGAFALFSALGAALFTRLKPRAGLCALAALTAVYGVFMYFIVKAGYVTPMLYTPAFCFVSYFAALAGHYAETRLNEARVRSTFGKYMAPAVVKKILDEGEEGLRLGGTRRRVTVLFVDIRGFTPLSESMRPEEVVGVLNEYLNLVASCIHEYGGTLDKFIGDAAMAIWGAPYAMEDHGLASVRASMAMRDRSAELSRKLQARFGREVSFGIGIHSGDAVVGNIGADFRMDYTAIGDTVNTAARLESNAKPGQILISQAAADELSSAPGIQIISLGGLKVKGKAEEVQIYEVL